MLRLCCTEKIHNSGWKINFQEIFNKYQILPRIHFSFYSMQLHLINNGHDFLDIYSKQIHRGQYEMHNINHTEGILPVKGNKNKNFSWQRDIQTEKVNYRNFLNCSKWPDSCYETY